MGDRAPQAQYQRERVQANAAYRARRRRREGK